MLEPSSFNSSIVSAMLTEEEPTIQRSNSIRHNVFAFLTAVSAMLARESDQYEMRSSWSRRLTADPSLRAGLLERLWRDPDGLLAEGVMIKDGDRCTVARVESDGEFYILKRYNRRGVLHTFLHWFARSRARWCWLNAQRVRAAGLLTPHVAALLEMRHGPFRDRSFLLQEYVQGKMLIDAVRDPAAPGLQLESLAEQFAHIWHRLAEARLGHRDMMATNFMIDGHGNVWLVDLDSMRCHRSRWLFDRRRKKDQARFMSNWSAHPEASRAFRGRLDAIARCMNQDPERAHRLASR